LKHLKLQVEQEVNMKLTHGCDRNMGTYGKILVLLWQIWSPYLRKEIALQNVREELRVLERVSSWRVPINYVIISILDQ